MKLPDLQIAFKRGPDPADTTAGIKPSEGELAKFAGRYEAKVTPIEVSVEVVGGLLKLGCSRSPGVHVDSRVGESIQDRERAGGLLCAVRNGRRKGQHDDHRAGTQREFQVDAKAMTGSRTDNEGAKAIRTFISIEIPESIKRRIGELQKALAQIKAPVSWIRPSNVHLTLKFLGAVSASRIERVSKAVERAASGIGPFEIEVGGAGCFPSIRNARVLWVGFSSIPGKLSDLYSNIETQLEEEGFPRESRNFSPHLTIGRIRIPGKGAAVAEQLAARGFDNERFTVTEIIVMRSDLKPTGSVYTPQSVIEL